MKTISYLLLAVFGYILSSCSEESSESSITEKEIRLTKNEVLSVSYDDTNELNDKDLFTMVNSFVSVENNAATRNSATAFKITRKTYINKEGEFEELEKATRSIGDNGITSKIYEVEFKNGSAIGRAVVSANGNLPSVIAYIPNCGNERVMESTGANELLHASKASYLYKALKMKELVDSLRNPTLEKISKELGLPIKEISYEKIKNNIVVVDVERTTRVTAVERQPIGVQRLPSSISPYVKTNWGQDYPYNDHFRIANIMDWVRDGNGGVNYGPVPAGCVNIAIAQMFTYTHTGRPFVLPIPHGLGTFAPDFDHMTRKPKLDDPGMTSTGRTHAQWIILHLYEMNKTTSKKDHANYVTSSEVAEGDMIKTMNNYFKYNAKASFDGDKAWAALRNKHLVLMLTTDHAFVISGILITEMADPKTRELVKTSDVYWHANFGWANECTGYYQLDSKANTYFEAGGTNQWCYKMEYLNNIQAK